jgi:hypothetical protein
MDRFGMGLGCILTNLEIEDCGLAIRIRPTKLPFEYIMNLIFNGDLKFEEKNIFQRIIITRQENGKLNFQRGINHLLKTAVNCTSTLWPLDSGLIIWASGRGKNFISAESLIFCFCRLLFETCR